MKMIKYHWDRDYHTVTNRTEVKTLDDIEDDWSGYNYWYEVVGQENRIKAEEARIIFKCTN